MVYDTLLKTENIFAGYGKREVLFGVDVKIDEGSSVLLMGPNGSGKSTFIKVIVGLLKPYKGKIFFKGEDISSLSVEKRINMGIGYLKQDRNIFPALTVRENLELGGYGLDSQGIKEGIERIFTYFPFLKEKLNIRAGLLSGGERQALAIGMVLMKRKEILLLDEPTAGLSPVAARKILESIMNIKEKEEKALLIVEHNIKLILNRIDKNIILKNGKIIKVVGKNEIFTEKIGKFFFLNNFLTKI